MFDALTGETLLQVSIYKISYCSADAVNSNVFAFVGTDDLTKCKTDERLVCYAFLCQKRKIAQKLTLTVAHCFEQAYQLWQDTSQRNKIILERRQRESERQQQQKTNLPHSVAPPDFTTSNDDQQCNDTNDFRSLLIDFSSEITAEICSKDHREFLQTTWVSFDDNNTDYTGTGHPQSNTTNSGTLWENKNLINCS